MSVSICVYVCAGVHVCMHVRMCVHASTILKRTVCEQLPKRSCEKT